MKIIKSLIIFLLFINFFNFNAAFSKNDNSSIIPFENNSNVIHADIKSERIPVGTMFEVRMETSVNSFNHEEGDSFRSTLLEDIRIGNLIVLPAGTLLRGRADYVKPGSRFSRGGELSLSFDHAVTPFGKHIPLVVNVTRAKNLTPEGIFSTGGGYINALEKNVDTGTEILTTTVTYCVDKGLSFWKGIPVAVTAPAGAFIGAIGGGGYFAGKSIYDMFKKGDNIKIDPGDIIEVTLIESLDVPTN